jgi:molybdenum-dependent DNA-binding transcriptional regulator ModE
MGRIEYRMSAAGSSMDLYKAIRDLYAEKEKLEKVIASLEELQKAAEAAGTPVVKKRRGRKSMDQSERQEVSERMRRYWANRRKQQRHENKKPEQA